MPIYALGEREPSIHPTAYVHPDAVVIGAVRLGEQATVWPGAVLRADYGVISVGARTSIQDGSIVHSDHSTSIGDDCIVGHNAHLHDCVIEDGCLIASMSVVLHGAVVRSGSLVGAHALVPPGMEVPTDMRALGVPAKLSAGGVDRELLSGGVEAYLHNASRYREQLRRL